MLVARTAVAPIARFTRQAEAIAAQPERLEHERLEVSGRDELARLGRTFNTTLDALERSIESQRNLVADASHELRTPIASLRANLQLLRDEALLPAVDREALRRDMIDELDGLTALVADVVELARGSKTQTARGEVRVDELVAEALARTRRRAPELTLTDELEPTTVEGEEERIARAIANLLDNAVKYGGEAGEVHVALAGGRLTVRDHGPGFHGEDLPYVFDRFHRARDARGSQAPVSGWRSSGRPPRPTAAQPRPPTHPGGGALMTVSFGPARSDGPRARGAGAPPSTTPSVLRPA